MLPAKHHTAVPSSDSSGTSVKLLARKYSSDSDASPVKPPEKKFHTGTGIINQASTSKMSGNGDGPQGGSDPNISLVEEMRNLAAEMRSLRADIINRIQVSEEKVMTALDTKMKAMEDKIMVEVSATRSKVDDLGLKFTDLERKLSDYGDRLRTVEDALAAGGAIVQEFDPEVTVIVTNVTYEEHEDVKTKCQQIIDHITSSTTPALEPIPLVNATRTPFRNGRAGVIKLQLPTRQNKIDVLKNKKSLGNHATYSNSFIRGSQSHTERLIHLNTNTLLNELGLADKYRVTGNGRLVPKEYPQQQQQYNRPPLGQPNNWQYFGPPGPPPGPTGYFGPQHNQRQPLNPRQNLRV